MGPWVSRLPEAAVLPFSRSVMYVSIASRELRLIEIGDFTSLDLLSLSLFLPSPSRSVLGFLVTRDATHALPEGRMRTPPRQPRMRTPPQHKGLDTPRCVANFKVGQTRGNPNPTVVALDPGSR